VPACDDQRASVGGDSTAYDRDLRPGLTAEVIAAVQDAGVEPTLCKIEGTDLSRPAPRGRQEDYARIRTRRAMVPIPPMSPKTASSTPSFV